MSLASPASLYLSFNYVDIGKITWITWKSEAIKSWEEFRRNWQLCWIGLPSTPVAAPRQWVSHSKLPVCSLLQIRTATRTQRDGAHWGKGSWRNGGCPNQTAPLFPLLLYSFPHSPLPETSGADFSWFTFPSSKAWLSQPKKAGIRSLLPRFSGFLVWISTVLSNFYICRFPNFAVDCDCDVSLSCFPKNKKSC